MPFFIVLLLLMLTPFPSQAQDSTGCSTALLFASDTQEPMWVESLFLTDNDNKQATRALFTELLTQEPTELFLLGDVVNLGYKNSRWTFIDSALTQAKERGFHVHALLGNHELMGRAASGERRFQERFPGHVRTGYTVVKDSIAVVLLNSNFGKLGKEGMRVQDAWYARTLHELDSLPSVRSIVVCCHHSPYSSSKLVGNNTAVQAHFVDPFLKARKTGLFISGHAHLFQHYSTDQKHFFVIGGGGGSHHPLRKDPGPNVCLEPDYNPLFHYLSVRLCNNTLQVVSHRLSDDLSGFDDGCDYVIPVPAARP